MDFPGPRADEPKRRRAFSAADKLAHLQAYEAAVEHGGGGGYLRREGLYSSLISEWRKQRDAGVLAGKKPGEKIGKLTAEQAEIARLTRENERLNKRLATTETALDIMGKDRGRLRGPAWTLKSSAVLTFRRGCVADAVGVRVTADPGRFAVL
ncbi:hypothetical protein [Nocardia sp. alder85J]|uniref:hypothetical protein n=1 Tax=Nocardia sp. alder85J TaxID=2862949 RepID=UPI0022517277|nr:hypothetical protein [Nocardia sp. alder85J]MCX4098007.1 hypothetical protein [Nocardia sp. alder85J]